MIRDYDSLKAQVMVSLFLSIKCFLIKVCTLFLDMMLLNN